MLAVTSECHYAKKRTLPRLAAVEECLGQTSEEHVRKKRTTTTATTKKKRALTLFGGGFEGTDRERSGLKEGSTLKWSESQTARTV